MLYMDGKGCELFPIRFSMMHYTDLKHTLYIRHEAVKLVICHPHKWQGWGVVDRISLFISQISPLKMSLLSFGTYQNIPKTTQTLCAWMSRVVKVRPW